MAEHIDWPSVGEFLKAVRRQRRISYRDLADQAGMSRGTLLRIEAGVPCKTSTLGKLEAALNLSPGVLTHLGHTTTDPFFLLEHRTEFIAIRQNPKYGKKLPNYSQKMLRDPSERQRIGKLGFVSAFVWEQQVGLNDASMRSVLMELHDATALNRHDGEELAFAVQGASILTIGDQKIVLHHNDKLSFRPMLPHRYAPHPSAVPSLLLTVWINAPTGFSVEYEEGAPGLSSGLPSG